MAKERKRCPKCHEMGSGPFLKPVWNQRRKRIYHYWYFAHRHGDKLKWCYIGKGSKEREEEREEEEAEVGRIVVKERRCLVCRKPATWVNMPGIDARCDEHVGRLSDGRVSMAWRRIG